MNRIGTYAQSQLFTADLTRLNQDQFKTQAQIVTGKTAQTFKDMPRDAQVLVSAKGVEARIDQFKNIAGEVSARLEIQDLHLEKLAGAADDLRQAVTTAIANESGLTTMDQLDMVFQTAVSALNATHNGNYLFGGTRTDSAPVTSNQLSDLTAAVNAGDLFTNNQLKPAAEVEEGISVEYGMLADELGTDLFDAIKRIADYNAGPNGPFGQTMTPGQKAFLEGELQTLRAVSEDLNGQVTANGLKQGQVEDVLSRHEAGDIFIKGFISDIEDVDLAEAISRLNADQVAVEAATRVVAQLNRLSLLDFI